MDVINILLPAYLSYSDSACKAWGLAVLPRSIASPGRAAVLTEYLDCELLVFPSLSVYMNASDTLLGRINDNVQYLLE